MKILIINTADTSGGAAAIARGVSHGISKMGHTSKFLVGYKYTTDPDVHTLDDGFAKLIPYKYRNLLVDRIRYTRTLIASNDIDFGVGKELLNQDYFKEADIVHCHNLQGGYFNLETLALISRHKPVVWTLHDMWPITAHCAHCYDCAKYNNGNHYTRGLNRHGADMLWDHSKYLWGKKKEVYKRCKNLTIVAPSMWLQNKLKSSILKEKPALHIPNGINTNLFAPGDKHEARRLVKLPLDKKIVLYVGQWGVMDNKKGADYFLWLVNELKDRQDVIFVCVGGASYPFIEKNAYYFPVSTGQEMATFYKCADLLLFPSLAENFPLTTLEAMSSGLPVVAFDVGGLKEQIENKTNGLVCNYKNRSDLKHAVEYLLGLDKRNIAEIKNRNRNKVVKLYSNKTMSESYLKLYEKLLKNK